MLDNHLSNSISFSIIIPIYNTQEYLEKCITSCLNQSFHKDHFEIILVNDGSTDDSFSIMKRYEKDYQNIHVVNQVNMGLSQARNNGVKVAKGKYVWFVDSDDWIEEYSLEKLHEISKTGPYDIIAFGAKNFIDNIMTKERPILLKEKSTISGIEVIERNMFQTCSTFYLYLRTFLQKHDLTFFPNIYHEDSEFIPRALYVADSVYPLNQNLYCVNEREGSITRSYIPKKSNDLFIVADNLIDYFYSNHIDNQKIKKTMNTRIATTLNSSLHNSKCNKNELFRLIEKISNNRKYLICFLGSRSIKHRVEGHVLHYPKIFYFCYWLLNFQAPPSLGTEA